VTTYKLTSNNPDPVTGLVTELMGWHFVATEAMGVFSSFDYLDRADWDYSLTKDPGNRKLQVLSLTKKIGMGTSPVQHPVKDTNWYGLGLGGFIKVLDQADVSTNWTVEPYSPPAQQ
jgi:hypothetical protein